MSLTEPSPRDRVRPPSDRAGLPVRSDLAYDHPASRLDRATLLGHALWSLAAEHMNLSDKDLLDRMHEIDLEDGVRDRKATVAPQRCECGAMIAAKPGWCMMCGEPGNFSPFHAI